MNTKKVYQTDHMGFYCGTTDADESPMEPGIYLMPAGAVEAAPPSEWPEDKWPRWNGSAWILASKPKSVQVDPVAKLQAFLNANPDVAAMLQQADGGASV